MSLLAACAESPSALPAAPNRAAQCGALRDHVVELRLDGVTVDREQHLRAQRSALGATFVEDCARDHDETALVCALGAADSTAVNACLAKAAP